MNKTEARFLSADWTDMFELIQYDYDEYRTVDLSRFEFAVRDSDNRWMFAFGRLRLFVSNPDVRPYSTWSLRQYNPDSDTMYPDVKRYLVKAAQMEYLPPVMNMLGREAATLNLKLNEAKLLCHGPHVMLEYGQNPDGAIKPLNRLVQELDTVECPLPDECSVTRYCQVLTDMCENRNVPSQVVFP